MSMSLKVGIDAEMIIFSRGYATASPWQSLTDRIGCDADRFTVEMREIHNNAYFLVNEALTTAYCIAKEGAVIQHPDFATGCHIHVDSPEFIEQRPTLLIELGELLESRARSDSPYGAKFIENREQPYGVEFRMLPSALLAFPLTLEECVKYLRLWIVTRQQHTLPYELKYKIKNLNFANRIVSMKYYAIQYEEGFGFEYMLDAFTVPIPAYLSWQDESMGNTIRASREVLACESIFDMRIMRIEKSMRIFLPKANQMLKDCLFFRDLLDAIRVEMKSIVITKRCLEDIDFEIASFIKAKRAEMRGKIRVEKKKLR